MSGEFLAQCVTKTFMWLKFKLSQEINKTNKLLSDCCMQVK